MSFLICQNLCMVRSGSRNRPTLCVKINTASSSLASIGPTPNQHSFTVTYLVNSCGFAPEKALKAAKYLILKNPDQPDSVIAFFRNHGFTKTQILNLIRKFPRLLLSNPDKTLLPKLDFLSSIGLSSSEVARAVLRNPYILHRSLENHIIPSFNVLRNLIGSEERTICTIKHSVGLPVVDLKAQLVPSVEILQAAGVPNAKISFLLTIQRRGLAVNSERFRRVVDEVRGMGFNPLEVKFVLAVHALIVMSELKWEKKIEVYKKWGLSEFEILVAFRKFPWCMTVSEDKITRVMDFLVNKMGLESSFLLERPNLIAYSLEKRIVPRCLVYETLRAKGLIKKTDINLGIMLQSPEKRFIKNVVKWGKEEAPELLNLYKEKLALAK